MKAVYNPDTIKISAADPFVKLEALRKWMNHKIDKWPAEHLPFESYLLMRYRYVIPGTVEWQISEARAIATNCYYCNHSFENVRRKPDNLWQITVDHFTPLSSGKKTEKYVICCYICNSRKTNLMPEIFAQRLLKADMTGFAFNGFSPKKIKTINERVRQISNDLLYNMGPTVYYIDNRKKSRNGAKILARPIIHESNQ